MHLAVNNDPGGYEFSVIILKWLKTRNKYLPHLKCDILSPACKDLRWLISDPSRSIIFTAVERSQINRTVPPMVFDLTGIEIDGFRTHYVHWLVVKARNWKIASKIVYHGKSKLIYFIMCVLMGDSKGLWCRNKWFYWVLQNLKYDSIFSRIALSRSFIFEFAKLVQMEIFTFYW